LCKERSTGSTVQGLPKREQVRRTKQTRFFSSSSGLMGKLSPFPPAYEYGGWVRACRTLPAPPGTEMQEHRLRSRVGFFSPTILRFLSLALLTALLHLCLSRFSRCHQYTSQTSYASLQLPSPPAHRSLDPLSCSFLRPSTPHLATLLTPPCALNPFPDCP
jgi:hypothetical protein